MPESTITKSSGTSLINPCREDLLVGARSIEQFKIDEAPTIRPEPVCEMRDLLI